MIGKTGWRLVIHCDTPIGVTVTVVCFHHEVQHYKVPTFVHLVGDNHQTSWQVYPFWQRHMKNWRWFSKFIDTTSAYEHNHMYSSNTCRITHSTPLAACFILIKFCSCFLQQIWSYKSIIEDLFRSLYSGFNDQSTWILKEKKKRY